MPQDDFVEFRAARAEDAALIREVVRSAYAKWIPMIGREPRPMVADYEQAVRDHRIDLMSVRSETVGIIETMLRDDHLWIENVAVRPEDQGKGFGRLLLDRAERQALELGHREIRLLTNAAFESNVALYEKAGYAVVNREPFMGGTTLYMSKHLGR